jgi:hypothetical protein
MDHSRNCDKHGEKESNRVHLYTSTMRFKSHSYICHHSYEHTLELEIEKVLDMLQVCFSNSLERQT